MIIDILYDMRLTSSTRGVLFGLLNHDFEHGDKGVIIEPKVNMTRKKKRIMAAKKEIDAIGGEFIFAGRGSQYIEIHFHIPK